MGSSVTVILSTHIVNDVSVTCQNFAIIKKGKLLGQSAPLKAIEDMEDKIWKKTLEKSEEITFRKQYHVLSSHFAMGKIRFRCYSDKPLSKAGFKAVNPNLEDFYFSIVHDKTL